MDTRIEELLMRWSWDPSDLSSAELTELEASAAGRRGMAELGVVRDRLSSAADVERDVVLREVGVAAHFGSDDAADRPAGNSGRWVGVALLAAAALIFVALWATGTFESPAPPVDIILGHGEDGLAEWDRDAGVIRWTEEPGFGGRVSIWILDGDATIKQVEFAEGTPEWQTRSYRVPDDVPNVFTFELRLLTAVGETEHQSHKLRVRRQ